jgi:tetratricopeptide (TPR) repeat protein
MTRNVIRLHAFVFFIAISWGVARAQTVSPHPDAAPASAAYAAKDWAKAADLYAQITASEPKNGRAWYRLGVSLHGKGDHEQAIKALEKSIENGAPNFLAEYQIPLCYASPKLNDKTQEYLERALRDGFGQPELMMSDAELNGMRSEASFQKLVEQAKRNQIPCTASLIFGWESRMS